MQSSASQTATMIAGYRARLTERADTLVDDPWADALAGTRGRALADAFDRVFAPMEHWVELRVAAIDRALADWPAPQVVVLGAGLDTRAARLAAPGRAFFEVDHPATQADKRERVAALDGYDPAVRYAACDFERADFLDALAAVGFDANRPAFVVWEGVVPYLTEAAVRATLERIASGFHPDSAVVFDTLGTRMVARRNVSKRDEQSMEFVDDLGEPVIFGVDRPIALVAECGFAWARSATFDQIALNLTGRYDRENMFAFQRLTLASPGRRPDW